MTLPVFFCNMVLLIILFLVIVFILWQLHKLIKNRSKTGWLSYIVFIPILPLAYYISAAIFPNDEFYKNDFKEVVNLEFPQRSKIGFKYASFPDHFGDYTSVFTVITQTLAYHQIKEQIKKSGFMPAKDNFYSPETQEALKSAETKLEEEFIKESEAGTSYYVGFGNDHKTIVIRRDSW